MKTRKYAGKDVSYGEMYAESGDKTVFSFDGKVYYVKGIVTFDEGIRQLREERLI